MHTSIPTRNGGDLPRAFCWTRFGPEAGESFDEILARKNEEREACDGTFYWGIGSAVGPALRALIATLKAPEVLFSPIRSAPRAVDVNPSQVVRWSAGTGLLGESVVLPQAACVTSRWDPRRPGAARYALVCASDAALAIEDHGALDFATLRNLSSGAPVGASQVTAVVQRGDEAPSRAGGRVYPVAMRARLVSPYLVRLTSPAFLGCPEQGKDPAVRIVPLQLAL
jgi:hypothetical protein